MLGAGDRERLVSVCLHLVEERCALGLHGGRPSRGVCLLACASREPGAPAAAPAAAADPAATWPELHRRPLAYAGDADAERAWLAGYAGRVSGGGCRCRAHWREWVDANAPDLSSPAAYARWTWSAHDAVSARVGRRRVDYAEAAAEWGWGAAEN